MRMKIPAPASAVPWTIVVVYPAASEKRIAMIPEASSSTSARLAASLYVTAPTTNSAITATPSPWEG